jgi:peptidoglycan/LPS O-acetylase OafA/YrhL
MEFPKTTKTEDIIDVHNSLGITTSLRNELTTNITNSKNESVKKLNALTSLRFFAAAMIVLLHSCGVLWLRPGQLGHFALSQGVSFFFVLSGFILTYVYPQFNETLTVKRFYLARFARIWPLHFAALLTGLIILLPESIEYIMQRTNALIGIMNASLIHGWIPIRLIFFSYNAVSWAVSVEFFFYLAFPLLIKDFDKTWLIKLTLSALLVISSIIFCNVTHVPLDNPLAPREISIAGIIYISPLCRLFEFVLGMCTALFWKKYLMCIKLNRFTGSVLELLAICISISAIYFSSMGPYPNFIKTSIGPAGCTYLDSAGSAIFFAALIFVMALESGVISNVLSLKIPVLLGEISYGIFLFHLIILRIYSMNAQKVSFIPTPILYLIFWIFLLVSSFLLLQVIEKPSRRLILSLWQNRAHERS